MVQFVFTPWRNRAELLRVRQHLFPAFSTTTSSTPPAAQQWWTTPTELAQLESAIARVFMWEHRGACPHVVISTARLLSALVLDAETPISSSALMHDAISSYYVNTFARFVTGLLDSQQDKARKMSMYEIARTLGLPAKFVELRHQGTHEAMPTLQQLRPAAREALVWIWEYYWRHLEPAEQHVSQEGDGVMKGLDTAVTANESPAMDAFNKRMCRKALLEYLQRRETVDATREGLMRQLKRWELGLVVAALVEIGESTRDRDVLARSVELARTILGSEEGTTGVRKDGDEAALRQELGLAVGKAEELKRSTSWGPKGTGKRKMGGLEAEDGAEKRDGWFKPKNWVPKPIGVL